MNIDRPSNLSDTTSTSAKSFCNEKKTSGAGSVNSDNDSGCALDEYTWVPSGLSPEEVIDIYIYMSFDGFKYYILD